MWQHITFPKVISYGRTYIKKSNSGRDIKIEFDKAGKKHVLINRLYQIVKDINQRQMKAWKNFLQQNYFQYVDKSTSMYAKVSILKEQESKRMSFLDRMSKNLCASGYYTQLPDSLGLVIHLSYNWYRLNFTH